MYINSLKTHLIRAFHFTFNQPRQPCKAAFSSPTKKNISPPPPSKTQHPPPFFHRFIPHATTPPLPSSSTPLPPPTIKTIPEPDWEDIDTAENTKFTAVSPTMISTFTGVPKVGITATTVVLETSAVLWRAKAESMTAPESVECPENKDGQSLKLLSLEVIPYLVCAHMIIKDMGFPSDVEE